MQFSIDSAHPHVQTIALVVLSWTMSIVATSFFHRRSRGKPTWFFTVKGADFLERTASGHSNARFWTRFGGANNCLVVAVTADRLIIRPFFPFTLLFVPEFWGLECDIPLKRVTYVATEHALFGDIVRVRFLGDKRDGDMTLRLSDPARFVALVQERRQ